MYHKTLADFLGRVVQPGNWKQVRTTPKDDAEILSLSHRAKELELEDRQARLQATFRISNMKPGTSVTFVPVSALSQFQSHLYFWAHFCHVM